ncbi:cyclin-dependent protein kinase regulator pho80 [Colletotrichum higginsianum]|nr:cyclin-dependent protein kinase regulator pho80 [Colletotrichum higginsianum]
MRATTLLSAFFAATLAAAETRLAKVYIEPVSPTPQTPALLAEIDPDLSAGANEGPVPKLVRIGIFDPSTSEWTSSVSVASTENFDKGYAPNIILSVDGVSEEVVGAGLKGVRIDAGATRDFGPQAVMRVSVQGKTPELNKPVVLSPEGRKVVQEEKPFWLKYVALILEVPENRGGRGVANVCAGTGG